MKAKDYLDELGISNLSFRLVRNPSGAKKDSRQARMTTQTNEQMKKQKSKSSILSNFQSSILNFNRGGFTLLEVMIALAVVGGLLVTLIYTLNYQLGLVERQETVTVATLLAKKKMMDMEKVPETNKGIFDAPFDGYTYETSVKDSPYPGIGEIIVSVKADKEEVKLNEFIFK